MCFIIPEGGYGLWYMVVITCPSGRGEDLRWMESRLQTKYEIKTKWLGPGPNHHHQVRVPNRIVTWEHVGIGYEAGPRHVEIMIE